MTRTRRRWLYVAAASSGIGLVVAVVGVVGDAPGRWREARKLTQTVGPLELHAVPAHEAIRHIVAQLRDPVAVGMCRQLATLPVTITLPTGATFHDALGAVSGSLGRPVVEWGSLHGDEVRPRFPCTTTEDNDYVLVPSDLLGVRTRVEGAR